VGDLNLIGLRAGDQGSRTKLPEARHRHVKGMACAERTHHHAPGQRQGHKIGQDARRSLPRGHDEHAQEQREQQTELLFQAERPGMPGAVGSGRRRQSSWCGREKRRWPPRPSSPRHCRQTPASRMAKERSSRRAASPAASQSAPAGCGARDAGRIWSEKRRSSISSKTARVITKPEITKNTSTPTKPPREPARPRWKAKMASTASARRPSTSGR
jgi:hypothetical protein